MNECDKASDNKKSAVVLGLERLGKEKGPFASRRHNNQLLIGIKKLTNAVIRVGNPSWISPANFICSLKREIRPGIASKSPGQYTTLEIPFNWAVSSSTVVITKYQKQRNFF